MNFKIKSISKIFILLAVLAFSSCQEEDLNQANENDASSIKVKEYTFQQASKISQFKKSFAKVSEGLAKKNKTNKTDDSNFVIDSSSIKAITVLGRTTYTMAIKRPQATPNYFENLIVKVSNTDSTKAYISKFTPSQKMIFNETHNSTSFHGTSEIKEIFYTKNIFTAKEGTICISMFMCDYGGATHPAGEKCATTYYDTKCYDLGGGGGAGAGGTGTSSGTSGSGTTGSTSGTSSGTGSNGSSDGGVYTAPVIPTYTSVNVTSVLSLNTAQQNWINSHGQIKKQLQQFLFANPFNDSNYNLALNAVNYLMANPNATFGQYQNWFSNTKEGLDDSYDDTFWNNSLTNFPQQTKPSYDDFFIGYPLHTDTRYDSPTNMYNAVGGQPLAIFNSSGNGNTCALRVSFALNESGVNIPNIPGKTFKGADNKYYFLGAANLLAWMKKTFGTPTGSNYLTGTQGGLNGVNFPTLLSGKKGIYCMIPNSTSGFGASGHIDILYPNTTCDGGCYFDAQIGGVKEIFIFELP